MKLDSVHACKPAGFEEVLKIFIQHFIKFIKHFIYLSIKKYLFNNEAIDHFLGFVAKRYLTKQG